MSLRADHGRHASGAVVSSITKRAVVVDALPQESVAVKVTSLSPVAPQRSLKATHGRGSRSQGRCKHRSPRHRRCRPTKLPTAAAFSSPVALHRVVRRHNRDGRIGRVFDDERRRRGAAVVAIVR